MVVELISEHQSKMRAWGQSLAKGVELCIAQGHLGDASTIIDIIKDICGVDNIPSQIVNIKVPYWEQRCPQCEEFGYTATRGIPQMVTCKNKHTWGK